MLKLKKKYNKQSTQNMCTYMFEKKTRASSYDANRILSIKTFAMCINV